jgi:hypothetical protein
LTRLIRSLALKMLIRNLGRHSAAPSPGHTHIEVPLKSVRTSPLDRPVRAVCAPTGGPSPASPPGAPTKAPRAPRHRRACEDVAQAGPPPIKTVPAVPSRLCPPFPLADAGRHRRARRSTRRRCRANQPIPSLAFPGANPVAPCLGQVPVSPEPGAQRRPPPLSSRAGTAAP